MPVSKENGNEKSTTEEHWCKLICTNVTRDIISAVVIVLSISMGNGYWMEVALDKAAVSNKPAWDK